MKPITTSRDHGVLSRHDGALRDDGTRAPSRTMAPSWAEEDEIEGDDRNLGSRTEPVEIGGLHRRR